MVGWWALTRRSEALSPADAFLVSWLGLLFFKKPKQGPCINKHGRSRNGNKAFAHVARNSHFARFTAVAQLPRVCSSLEHSPTVAGARRWGSTMAKGDSKIEVAEESTAPPNFFCRLPPAQKAQKLRRSGSPPPLAFLQHIIANYKQDEEVTQGVQQLQDHAGTSWRGDSIAIEGPEGGRGDLDEGIEASLLQDGTRGAESHASPLLDAGPPDDAPWFSQLANLPQVRSAGVPLVTPSLSQRSKEGSRKPKVAGPATASSRTMDLTHSSTSMRTTSSASSLDTAVGVPASADAFPYRAGALSTHLSSASAQATTSTSSAPLVPPENFAMVNSWVYRSSFPKKRHFPFLKTLGLKSVLWVMRRARIEVGGWNADSVTRPYFLSLVALSSWKSIPSRIRSFSTTTASPFSSLAFPATRSRLFKFLRTRSRPRSSRFWIGEIIQC